MPCCHEDRLIYTQDVSDERVQLADRCWDICLDQDRGNTNIYGETPQTEKIVELHACDFFDSRAIPYKYLAKDTLSRGGVDIRIGNLEMTEESQLAIDFNGRSLSFWPETWGGLCVHVKEKQHQQERESNIYLFGQYNMEKQKAALVGWVWKREWSDISEFHEKGSKVQVGKTWVVVSDDMRNAKVSDIRPLYELTVECIRVLPPDPTSKCFT